MDFRTTIRELDEVIGKTQLAIAHELQELNAMPSSNGRRGKERRLFTLQAYLVRLRKLRVALKQRRPAGSRLH